MTAARLPLGSDCFIPIKKGWRTGYRGTLKQYVDHPDGAFALIESLDKRTFRCRVEYLELWEDRPGEYHEGNVRATAAHEGH